MWTGLSARTPVTVLPSVASLKVLRGKSAVAAATKPLIGFADPVFDARGLKQNARIAAAETASRGIRGTVADIAELRTALPPLPANRLNIFMIDDKRTGGTRDVPPAVFSNSP